MDGGSLAAGWAAMGGGLFVSRMSTCRTPRSLRSIGQHVPSLRVGLLAAWRHGRRFRRLHCLCHTHDPSAPRTVPPLSRARAGTSRPLAPRVSCVCVLGIMPSASVPPCGAAVWRSAGAGPRVLAAGRLLESLLGQMPHNVVGNVKILQLTEVIALQQTKTHSVTSPLADSLAFPAGQGRGGSVHYP